MEELIWILAIWGCAVLFSGIGIYAGNRKDPMWFWTGSTVLPEKVKDIPAYNRANRKMWLLYSIPFWITGITYYWFDIESAIVMVVACTGGIGWLIWYYSKIEEKYIIK